MSGKEQTPHRPLATFTFRTPDDRRVRGLRLALERERAELQQFHASQCTPQNPGIMTRTPASTSKSLTIVDKTQEPGSPSHLHTGGTAHQWERSPDSGEKRVEGLRAAVWRGRAELMQLEHMIQGRRRSLVNYTPQKPIRPSPACQTCPRPPKRPAYSPPTTKENAGLRVPPSVGKRTLKVWNKAAQCCMISRKKVQVKALKNWRAASELRKRLRQCCALFLTAVKESVLQHHFYNWYHQLIRTKKVIELQKGICQRTTRTALITWTTRVRCIKASESRCSRAKRMTQRRAIEGWRRRTLVMNQMFQFHGRVTDSSLQLVLGAWQLYASRHQLCEARSKHHRHLVHLRGMREVWFTWRSEVVNSSTASLHFKKLADELLSTHMRRVVSSCYRRAIGKRAMGAIACRLLMTSMRDSVRTLSHRNQELQCRIHDARKLRSSLLLSNTASTLTFGYKLGEIAALKLSSCFETWLAFSHHRRHNAAMVTSVRARWHRRTCRAYFEAWWGRLHCSETSACSGESAAAMQTRVLAQQFAAWANRTQADKRSRRVALRVSHTAALALCSRALSSWTAVTLERKAYRIRGRQLQWRAARRRLLLALKAWVEAVCPGDFGLRLAAVRTSPVRSLTLCLRDWSLAAVFSRRSARILAARAAYSRSRALSDAFQGWRHRTACIRCVQRKAEAIRRRSQAADCRAVTWGWRAWCEREAQVRSLVRGAERSRGRRMQTTILREWQSAASPQETQVATQAPRQMVGVCLRAWSGWCVASLRCRRILAARAAYSRSRALSDAFQGWRHRTACIRCVQRKAEAIRRRSQAADCRAVTWGWRAWCEGEEQRRQQARLRTKRLMACALQAWQEVAIAKLAEHLRQIAPPHFSAGGLRQSFQGWLRYASRRRWRLASAVLAVWDLASPAGGHAAPASLRVTAVRRSVRGALQEWGQLAAEAARVRGVVRLAAKARAAEKLRRCVELWQAAARSRGQRQRAAAVHGRALRKGRLWFDAWKFSLDRRLIPDTIATAKRRRVAAEGKLRALQDWRLWTVLQRGRWRAFEQLRRRYAAFLRADLFAHWQHCAGVALPRPLVCPNPTARELLLPACAAPCTSEAASVLRDCFRRWDRLLIEQASLQTAVRRSLASKRSQGLTCWLAAWATAVRDAQKATAVSEMLMRATRAMYYSRTLCGWRAYTAVKYSGGDGQSSLHSEEAASAQLNAQQDGGKEVVDAAESCVRRRLQGALKGWRERAARARRAQTLCGHQHQRRRRELRRAALHAWHLAGRERRQKQQLLAVARARAEGRGLKAVLEYWMLKAASRKRLRRVGRSIAQRNSAAAQRHAVACWRQCERFRQLREMSRVCREDVQRRLLGYAYALWQKHKYLVHCETYLRDARLLSLSLHSFGAWKALASPCISQRWTECCNRLLLIHTLEHQLEKASTPRSRPSSTPAKAAGTSRRSCAALLREGKQGLLLELAHAWRQLAKARGQSRRLAVSMVSRKTQRQVACMAVVWWKTLAKEGRRRSKTQPRIDKALRREQQRFAALAFAAWLLAAQQRVHARATLTALADRANWHRCEEALTGWRQHLETLKEVEHVAVSCLWLKQKQEALHAWAKCAAEARGGHGCVAVSPDRNNAAAISASPSKIGSPATSGRALQAISPNLVQHSSKKMKKTAPASPNAFRLQGLMQAGRAVEDGATPLRLPVHVQYPKDPLGESGGGRGVVEAQLIIDASSSSRDDGLVEAELITTKVGQLEATPRRGETHTVVRGLEEESSLVFLPVSPSRFASAPLEAEATPLRAALALQYPPSFTPAPQLARSRGAGGTPGSEGWTPQRSMGRSGLRVPWPCLEEVREESRGSSMDRLSLDPSEPRTSLDPSEGGRPSCAASEGGRESLVGHGGELEVLEAQRVDSLERVLFGDRPSLAHPSPSLTHPSPPRSPPKALAPGDSPLPPPPPRSVDHSPLLLPPFAKSPAVREWAGTSVY